MSRVTIIVGLPGSGKTYLANHFAQQHNAVVFDDIVREDIPRLLTALAAGQDCVVTDPHLCDEAQRKACATMVAEHDTQWVFFANDPDACLRNVAQRNDGRVVTKTILQYAKLYAPDAACDIVPVWQAA